MKTQSVTVKTLVTEINYRISRSEKNSEYRDGKAAYLKGKRLWYFGTEGGYELDGWYRITRFEERGVYVDVTAVRVEI